MCANWFTIKKIHNNLWGIGEFRHNEQVISYLIEGNSKSVLIDTGMGIENINTVVSSLTKKPLKIINTHTHFDHIGGNSYFSDISIFDHDFALNRSKKGYTNKELSQFVNSEQSLDMNFEKYSIKPFKVKTKLKDGDIISCFPFQFKIIHTPGHSPDSICIFEEQSKILFSGDTLYNGPLYLHLPESDIKAYAQSLYKLSTIRNIRFICPGHNHFSISKKYLKILIDVINNKDKVVKKTIISRMSIIT